MDDVTSKPDVGDGDDPVAVAVADPTIISRAYQIEMLEASVKGNTIVVMETGSGKTQVAVERIRYALEKGTGSKIIWFLTPTVALCAQQHRVLQRALPSIAIRMLVGDDNVDRWSTPEIWQTILDAHPLILSTHAVLADALDNGFVRIRQLDLLVFDEAHHCTGDHPAHRIMRDHYHVQRRRQERSNSTITSDLPHILGLTASLTMKSRVDSRTLAAIERNLHAVARSPRIHRAELRRHVHIPELIRITCGMEPPPPEQSLLLQHLRAANADFGAYLAAHPPPWLPSIDPASDALQRKTAALRTDVRKFTSAAEHIDGQLGPYAADFYILLCLEKLRSAVSATTSSALLPDFPDDKHYLHTYLRTRLLDPLPRSATLCPPTAVSEKFRRLVAFLAQPTETTSSTSTPPPPTTGILFAHRRVTAALLPLLLARHPRTRHLRSGAFLGTAYSPSSSSSSSLADLLAPSPRTQDAHLTRFRTRALDLLVATSVLEEGIDVPDCGLVVCFDAPASLTGWVQRRGRARRAGGRFVVFSTVGEDSGERWAGLERGMRRAVEEREAQGVEGEEEEEGMEEEDDDECMTIPHTGATLRPLNAVQHLFHFCAALPRWEFVDPRPIFGYEADDPTGLLRAWLLLPNALDPPLRRFAARRPWRTEKRARRDVAFVACRALHAAGLLDDHLMPTPAVRGEVRFDVRSLDAATVMLPRAWDPWEEVGRKWMGLRGKEGMRVWGCRVVVERPGREVLRMWLLLPVPLPDLAREGEARLFWDARTVVRVQVAEARSLDVTPAFLQRARRVSEVIVRSVHAPRMEKGCDLAALFVPALDVEGLDAWLERHEGWDPAEEVLREAEKSEVLVRSTLVHGLWVYRGGRVEGDAMEVVRLKRKRNFLHAPPQQQEQSHNSTREPQWLTLADSTVDRLPLDMVEFALLIPSILHHLEIGWTAAAAHAALFPTVSFSGGAQHLRAALCAPAANAPSHYQRLEFLGDSVLKYLTSLALFVRHPRWHEGYLSGAKHQRVCNARLARAALDARLSDYIRTAAFAARKWRPPAVPPAPVHGPVPGRSVATKVLADVVEALIGAAWLHAGFPLAAELAAAFLPELADCPLDIPLRPSPPLPLPPPSASASLDALQRLLAYRFTHPALLQEAFTHPSVSAPLAPPSYQRLEFLGDALLDMLVVRALASAPAGPGGSAALSHITMHLLKTAVVNADVLAYLALRFSTPQSRPTVVVDTGRTTTTTPVLRMETHHLALPAFLSVASAPASRVRHLRLTALRVPRDLLDLNGEGEGQREREGQRKKTHPWASLARLALPKFFSDVVESVVAAVFLDASLAAEGRGGDGAASGWRACEALLRRLGVLGYLGVLMEGLGEGGGDRGIRAGVELRHPKSVLAERVAREARGRGEGKGRGRVSYVVRRVRDAAAGDGQGGQGGDGEGFREAFGPEEEWFTCEVVIGEERFVDLGAAVGKPAAVALVAEEVLRRLEGRDRGREREEGG